MPLSASKPLTWSPYGAADTLDSSSSSRPGAMASLQNLIPDPTTKDLWQCRPAAIELADLANFGFDSPTFISGTVMVGTRLYGMVSTSRFPGQDEPFCYDVAANQVVPFTAAPQPGGPTGQPITAVTCPISPQQTGEWVPPCLVLVGSKIIVTHPGFTGAGDAYFGVMDTSDPDNLTWTAQNVTPSAATAPNPPVLLPSPPVWAANFNQRCYFLCNAPGQPVAIFSDVLEPTQTTNNAATGLGTPVITFGDNIPLTCAAGLGLWNQNGGITQALIVFKSAANMYQITGDAALGNLNVNSMNVATGTLSPLSVNSSTQGLAFIAPDGLRVVNFYGMVSDPVGNNGEGITLPFIASAVPSRVNATFNNGIYRVQVQNGAAPGAPQQEWWYDAVRKIWSGPHTTNVSMIEAYQGTFLVTLQGARGKIFQSDSVQSPSSLFIENGTQLTYNFQSAYLPDADVMAESCIIESTVYAQLPAQGNISVMALDASGKMLDNVLITAAGLPTLWGLFSWGEAPWQGPVSGLMPRQHLWTEPLVFRRVSLAHTGMSNSTVKLGRMQLRYRPLGYLQQDLGINMPLVLGIGTFTLTPNAQQTVVAAPSTTNTQIFISPMTPDAANDMATTSIVPGNGSFTVNHANNPRTDRTFAYQVVG